MNIGLLVASCLTASLSPGPAALSTIETALRYGKRRTFWHTLGLAVGETPHLFLALFGTAWLTQHLPFTPHVIAVTGALYFLWLGLGLLVRPRATLPSAVGLAGGALRLFLRGAWVNFSNPKTIPWMLVIIQAAQVPAAAVWSTTTGLFLLCTVGSELAVMSFYAFLGDRLRVHLQEPATIRWVDRITGVLWLLLATLLMVQSWKLFI